MKHTAQTIQKIDRVSGVLFWALCVAIVLMSFSYVFFIQKTIRNVVQRQNLQVEIATLNSKLSATEFSYINSVSAITLETARELGYTSATEKTFVTREKVGQNVAIR